MKNNNFIFGDIPAEHLRTEKTLHLIHVYEKLHHIPKADHITGYDDERLQTLYEKALTVLERNSNDYQCINLFKFEDEVLKYMRSCMVSKNVNAGDSVICVPAESVRPHYIYERIDWIDENKLCGVKLMGNERWIPLWQVLAKFNEEVPDIGAFNMPHAELLCLGNEDEALPFLHFVQKQYDEISHSLNIMTEAFGNSGLMSDSGQPLDESDEDESSGMVMQ